MEEEKLKIRLRLRPGPGPYAGERLWAGPVDVHDAGGVHMLMNNSFYAPLAVGDLVQTGLDGSGGLQITGVVMPAPVLLTAFELTRKGEAESGPLGERWRRGGATCSERGEGVVMTVWGPGVTEEQVAAVLGPEQEAGRGRWHTIPPEQRVSECLLAADLELDPVDHFPARPTSYWAPDDPWWARHGLGSPDFLAHVQALAGSDDEIAEALEAGEHEKVIEIINWIQENT